jgi:hypothetical protein
MTDRAVHGSFRVLIRIQTPPDYDPTIGDIREGATWGFDTDDREGPSRDLISVVVSKQLNAPCGRFALTFTPRQPITGYTWADLIPGYSLVEIWMQRYPDNPEPVLVMLGLTDTRLESEVYGIAEQQIQIQIAGREVSCIFVDQKTLYLPTPPETLATQPVLAGQPATVPKLPPLYASATQLLGMVAIDPKLAFEGASPVEVLDRFIRMATVGLKTDYNQEGLPLLNLELPNAKLADLIVFDATTATAKLFDPNALLPGGSQLDLSDRALWDLMTTWSDPNYQELFPRTADLGPTRRSYVEMIFRKKPFAGRINKAGEVIEVRGPSGSQFDLDFQQSADDNVSIDDSDVVAMSLRRSTAGVRNLYYVLPQASALVQFDAREIYGPLIDAAENSPASIRRYGLRMMQVADYYIRDPATTVIVKTATERARLLWSWHRFEALFYQGQYSLKGIPELQVGKRLVHRGRDINREYYVTAVTHAAELGSQHPRLLTTVGVERGWPLLGGSA